MPDHDEQPIRKKELIKRYILESVCKYCRNYKYIRMINVLHESAICPPHIYSYISLQHTVELHILETMLKKLVSFTFQMLLVLDKQLIPYMDT